MKVPPKRKGNVDIETVKKRTATSLNESPSEKEGKYVSVQSNVASGWLALNESPSEKEGKSAGAAARVYFWVPQ